MMWGRYLYFNKILHLEKLMRTTTRLINQILHISLFHKIISFTISLLHNKLILFLHIVLVAMHQNCLLYLSTFIVYPVYLWSPYLSEVHAFNGKERFLIIVFQKGASSQQSGALGTKNDASMTSDMSGTSAHWLCFGFTKLCLFLPTQDQDCHSAQDDWRPCIRKIPHSCLCGSSSSTPTGQLWPSHCPPMNIQQNPAICELLEPEYQNIHG